MPPPPARGSGLPSNPFTIRSISDTSAFITVNTPSALDYEAVSGEKFTLQVKVEDDGIGGSNTGRQSSTHTIEVLLTDINEGPTVTGSQTWSVAENTALATESSAFTANDPDTKNPAFSALTWTHTRATDFSTGNTVTSPFSTSMPSGKLTVSRAIDYETQTQKVC